MPALLLCSAYFFVANGGKSQLLLDEWRICSKNVSLNFGVEVALVNVEYGKRRGVIGVM